MAKTINPFAGNWAPVANIVFDRIMPEISMAAWKVLSVVIRQTWGWAAGDGSGRRREWDVISYSQFKEKTGIGSYSTISRAIKECLEGGYLVRRQVDTHQGTGKPIYAYALNADFELEVEGDAAAESDAGTEEPVAGSTADEASTTEAVAEESSADEAATEGVVEKSPATKDVVGATTGGVVEATTVGVDTKETGNKQKQNDDDESNNKDNKNKGNKNKLNFSPEQQEKLKILQDNGADVNSTVLEVIQRRSLDDIRGMIDAAKERNLENPIGWVIAQLRDGREVPEDDHKGKSSPFTTSEERRKYKRWAQAQI